MHFHPASSLTWAASAASPTLAFVCGEGHTPQEARGSRLAFSVARPLLSLVCTVLPSLIYSCRRKSFTVLCSVVYLWLIQCQHKTSFPTLQRGFQQLLSGLRQQGLCDARRSRAMHGPLAFGKASKSTMKSCMASRA